MSETHVEAVDRGTTLPRSVAEEIREAEAARISLRQLFEKRGRLSQERPAAA